MWPRPNCVSRGVPPRPSRAALWRPAPSISAALPAGPTMTSRSVTDTGVTSVMEPTRRVFVRPTGRMPTSAPDRRWRASSARFDWAAATADAAVAPIVSNSVPPKRSRTAVRYASTRPASPLRTASARRSAAAPSSSAAVTPPVETWMSATVACWRSARTRAARPNNASNVGVRASHTLRRSSPEADTASANPTRAWWAMVCT